MSRRVRIDPEAYGVRRTASPGERLLAARAGREHGAGPVGAAAQRAEDVARATVDAHPLDALDGFGVGDAFDGQEAAGRRDEEDDTRATGD